MGEVMIQALAALPGLMGAMGGTGAATGAAGGMSGLGNLMGMMGGGQKEKKPTDPQFRFGQNPMQQRGMALDNMGAE